MCRYICATYKISLYVKYLLTMRWVRVSIRNPKFQVTYFAPRTEYPGHDRCVPPQLCRWKKNLFVAINFSSSELLPFAPWTGRKTDRRRWEQCLHYSFLDDDGNNKRSISRILESLHTNGKYNRPSYIYVGHFIFITFVVTFVTVRKPHKIFA